MNIQQIVDYHEMKQVTESGRAALHEESNNNTSSGSQTGDLESGRGTSGIGSICWGGASASAACGWHTWDAASWHTWDDSGLWVVGRNRNDSGVDWVGGGLGAARWARLSVDGLGDERYDGSVERDGGVAGLPVGVGEGLGLADSGRGVVVVASWVRAVWGSAVSVRSWLIRWLWG